MTCPVGFVTKWLAVTGAGVKTYEVTIPGALENLRAFINIGGPYVALELANRWPSASIYASADPGAIEAQILLMRTDYYHLS